MSARVTSRPMEMPKWVAEERRGRSGQGQEEMSERSLGRDRSSPEEMTQDLSLLIPRPERVEKVEMMEREGRCQRHGGQTSPSHPQKQNT